jgi:hypothetical protein
VLPDDPGIPALRALASEGFGPLLSRPGVSDDVERVRLVGHQPGRCTFEVTCGEGRMALKAYSPARAPALDLCECLSRLAAAEPAVAARIERLLDACRRLGDVAPTGAVWHPP